MLLDGVLHILLRVIDDMVTSPSESRNFWCLDHVPFMASFPRDCFTFHILLTCASSLIINLFAF